MKLKILFIALIASTLTTTAQTLDDFGRVTLKVQVSDKKMSDEARQLLENKMQQMVTHFGIGSAYGDSRFVMEAKVDVLNKDVTATAPQRISQKLEVTFYTGDVVLQKVFSNVSVTCVGVGTNETKSFIAALKQINPQGESFRAFLEEGKNEIIAFYNTECAKIQAEAASLAEQGKYDEAIYNLALVPDVCADCYGECLKLQGEYYTQKIETQGQSLFTQAKATWAAQPNADGGGKVARLLAGINPRVSFIGDVHGFAKEVSAVVQAQELREWEQKVQEYNDRLADARMRADREYVLTQQRIKAYRDVAVEYARNQPKTVYRALII
ncbi:MAG: hypothetical protein LBS43_10030 [Prevotellaceae bacterium]|jgi:hypothetical protein|nr:hypothetical protein [Prevotellaceae bacterium]